MVLSNAERQKRFREKLKAAARGEDLSERARSAIDAGMTAVWAIVHRGNWGGYEDWSSVDEWKRSLADPKFQRANGRPVDYLFMTFDGMLDETNEPRERAAIRRARDLLAVVSLRDGHL